MATYSSIVGKSQGQRSLKGYSSKVYKELDMTECARVQVSAHVCLHMHAHARTHTHMCACTHTHTLSPNSSWASQIPRKGPSNPLFVG